MLIKSFDCLDRRTALIVAHLGNGIKAGSLTWKGKTKVLIVSLGPGKSSADIFVPGKPNLKSRFGKTVNLGGGRYRFTGLHVTSDVLE